jgi:hypothetical protein
MFNKRGFVHEQLVTIILWIALFIMMGVIFYKLRGVFSG